MSDMSMTREFTVGPLTLEEMFKIVSLLENPPEAEGVRRALRFYEVPENVVNGPATWGTVEEVRKMLVHFRCPQNPVELDWLIGHLNGATSLLEIGSSFGGTLKKMASVMPRGSKIVSVDLACDDTPKFLNPEASLRETCRQIAMLGASVELFIGNSHSAQVVEAVSRYAPFDFAFIDGDHTYEGVKADWENYGPMARLVAFHDIFALPEVRRFWEELKSAGEYETEECVWNEGDAYGFGIGLVKME